MILFVAAESRECRGLAQHLQNRRKPGWPLAYAVTGTLNDRPVALVAHGPGPRLATCAAKIAGEQITVDAVVSTGFCGALDPALEPGCIFIASELVDSSGGVTAHAASVSTGVQAATGKLLSIDHVASSAAEKLELSATGAGAVEMEAAGVAAWAFDRKVPFYCIRVVTDGAMEGFSLDFNGLRDSEGRFSRWMIIKAACRQPLKLFPELMQLDRRCNQAAYTLGDFIADCQF